MHAWTHLTFLGQPSSCWNSSREKVAGSILACREWGGGPRRMEGGRRQDKGRRQPVCCPSARCCAWRRLAAGGSCLASNPRTSAAGRQTSQPSAAGRRWCHPSSSEAGAGQPSPFALQCFCGTCSMHMGGCAQDASQRQPPHAGAGEPSGCWPQSGITALRSARHATEQLVSCLSMRQ